MRSFRLIPSITLALTCRGVVRRTCTPASRAAYQLDRHSDGRGARKSDPRMAYRDALTHLYGGGRVHWAA